MNIGREMVSVILREGSVKGSIDAGFTTDWLDDPVGGSEAVFDGDDYSAYRYLLDHHKQHRKCPDIELFKANFPNYRLSARDISFDEIIELAIRSVRHNLVDRFLSDALDLQDSEKYEKISALFEHASETLTNGFRVDKNVAIDLGDAEFDIEAYLNEIKEMGIPMGVETIDEDFWGWQPGQLITFIGRQKAGKTTLLINSALAAWEEGYSVLVFSVELNQDEIRQKVLSLGAGVSPQRLRRRTLHSSEREKVIDFDKRLKHDAEDVFFLISNKVQLMTINDIKEEIEKYQPHAVFVDGTYFIHDPITKSTPSSDWKADNNVSEQLKLVAQQYELPVIVTTQSQEKQQGNSKKRGIEAKTIQGGTGLLKFSDLVLGIDMPDDSGVQMVNTLLSRFSPGADTLIRWDWNDMSLEELEPEAFELEDTDL